jgi:hypothetical protein
MLPRRAFARKRVTILWRLSGASWVGSNSTGSVVSRRWSTRRFIRRVSRVGTVPSAFHDLSAARTSSTTFTTPSMPTNRSSSGDQTYAASAASECILLCRCSSCTDRIGHPMNLVLGSCWRRRATIALLIGLGLLELPECSDALLPLTTECRNYVGSTPSLPQNGVGKRLGDRPRFQMIDFVGAFGSPGWIRTSDHSINSRMLYR